MRHGSTLRLPDHLLYVGTPSCRHYLLLIHGGLLTQGPLPTLLEIHPYPLLPLVLTKRFRAVVKHTKYKSNKIHKTELTKITYKIK